MKITDKISNGMDVYEIENVGRNDGCTFCGNEQCDLFNVYSDSLVSFETVAGGNYICRKCLPDVLDTTGFSFV